MLGACEMYVIMDKVETYVTRLETVGVEFSVLFTKVGFMFARMHIAEARLKKRM